MERVRIRPRDGVEETEVWCDGCTKLLKSDDIQNHPNEHVRKGREFVFLRTQGKDYCPQCVDARKPFHQFSGNVSNPKGEMLPVIDDRIPADVRFLFE